MTGRDTIVIIRQILQALEYIHDHHGIAHMDLKPSNVMLNFDGAIKLADFQLAKPAKHPVKVEDVGTLKYMAPECFEVQDYPTENSKVDMWATGIILYQMLHGEHPFIPSNVAMSKMDVKHSVLQFNGAQLRGADEECILVCLRSVGC